MTATLTSSWERTFHARTHASPEAMIAAAAHVGREYGHYGYRLGVSDDVNCPRIYVFEVVCSDGSRFNLVADIYGNVRRIPDEASREEAIELIRDMAREAGRP